MQTRAVRRTAPKVNNCLQERTQQQPRPEVNQGRRMFVVGLAAGALSLLIPGCRDNRALDQLRLHRREFKRFQEEVREALSSKGAAPAAPKWGLTLCNCLLSPEKGERGTSNLSIENFGVTLVKNGEILKAGKPEGVTISLEDGIKVIPGSIVVVGEGRLNFRINIESGARLGWRNITVTHGNKHAIEKNVFQVVERQEEAPPARKTRKSRRRKESKRGTKKTRGTRKIGKDKIKKSRKPPKKFNPFG